MNLDVIKCILGKEATYEDYVDYLLNTVQTARPGRYFVDWNKVKKNVGKYAPEIKLLEYVFMDDGKDRVEKLREVFNCWKNKEKLGKALILLVAYRYGNNGFYLRIEDGVMKVDVKDVDSLILFANETGLIKELTVENIMDYVTGVEVGLDSNARKNRSGEMFEKFVCAPLLRNVFGFHYSIVYQDKQVNLWKNISSGKAKWHDFVVYEGNVPKAVVECTFIGTSGSKPTAIAESYPALSILAKERNMRFIWLIDGDGWKKQRSDLISAVKEIDIVVSPEVLRGLKMNKCLCL